MARSTVGTYVLFVLEERGLQHRVHVPVAELLILNHLTPNGHYMGRTAQLTSRRYILYIYSTNIRTEYFKHAA